MKERFELNLEEIDSNVQETISLIEQKGHALYIRYLLTKRYGPRYLQDELKKMGLSSPAEQGIIAYFNNVIWPAAVRYGVECLYDDYRNKINHMSQFKIYDFSKRILRFRVDLEKKLDLQPRFLGFLYYLGLEPLWSCEVYGYFGTTSKLPCDSDGDKPFDATYLQVRNSPKTIEKIVLSPKRYIVDRMILEDISPKRISEYCKKDLSLNLSEYEVVLYRKVFFNIRVRTIEEKIKDMEREQKYFDNQFKLYSNSGSAEYKTTEPGERAAILKSVTQRLEEIKTNLYSLNAKFHRSVENIMADEKMSSKEMMQNMMVAAYRKFTILDKSDDRDTIKPLFDLTRIVTMLDDKMGKLDMSTGTGGGGMADNFANAELLKLCADTIEEMKVPGGPVADMDEMGISLDDIGGVDELGVTYKDGTDDE